LLDIKSSSILFIALIESMISLMPLNVVTEHCVEQNLVIWILVTLACSECFSEDVLSKTTWV